MIKPLKKLYPQFWLTLIILFVFPAELLVQYFLNSFDLEFRHFAIANASIIMLVLVGAMVAFMYKPHKDYLKKNKLDDLSIQSREERYRMIFENVQDVYYEVTGDGIITELSPSITRISKGQFSREELLGTSVYGLYFDVSERDHLLSLLTLKGFVDDHEIRLRNKDGSVFQCSVSASLLLNDQKMPVKITGIMRDISLRKQTEESIRQKNEELRQINSEKDKLFSIIAHDLRTPFNAFIGLTEILVRKSHTISAEEIKKYAASMHTTAINLYTLLENLLLWSGNRQGTIAFQLQSQKLRPLILESICTLKEIAEKKNIELLLDVPDDLMVQADSNAFQTVLRNLVTNAIKFTHRNGKVSISAEQAEDGYVRVCCSDNGIGIEPDVIGKLFSIQSKINRLGTEGEPSTGLGLLLCKEFVEKHGGTISVFSEPGNGSRFCFTLFGVEPK